MGTSTGQTPGCTSRRSDQPLVLLDYLCPKDVAGSTALLSLESSAPKMRRWGKAQPQLPRALQRGRGDKVRLLPKRCVCGRAGSDLALSIAAARGVLSTQHVRVGVGWGA